MPLNLKVHHRTILPCHLQINVIIVLSPSLVFLSAMVISGVSSAAVSPDPHQTRTQAAPGTAEEAAYSFELHSLFLLCPQSGQAQLLSFLTLAGDLNHTSLCHKRSTPISFPCFCKQLADFLGIPALLFLESFIV